MENRREANRSGSEELDHLEDKVKVDEEEEAVPVEKIFEDGEVPTWRKQLTLRGMAVSFVLSVVFSFTAIKLNLTTGIIPSSTVSARLLGFFFVKIWNQSRMLKQPFTPQENTVIQTCVVAASGIAFSGGFGSYLFGMSERIAKQSAEIKGNHDYKNPSLGWMIGFLFLVSFVGLFSMVPLRKIMIIDFKLTYPSGTAVGHLINNFHTREGFELAKKPVRELGKFFSFSFLWGFFQWFFTAGEKCGFGSFPMFGLKAYEHRFLFDFSATFIGIGMICPHIINISVLVGGILSWGIMWPLIGTKKGDWYSAELDPHSLQGLQGYKIFLGAAMILGDGLYNFFKVLIRTLAGLLTFMQHKNATKRLPVADNHLTPVSPPLSFDDQRQTHLFLKDQIPPFFAIGGYIVIAAISTATIPHIFHQLKWYYVMVIYIFAPIMGFCNAFGCGLTDWNYSSTYGKLAIFLIGAWAGASHGGVLVGLAACGVMMNIVTTACNLTKDFKTGYLTLTSPRSMFVSQVIGTAMGCVISPCVFWIFYKAFPDLGLPQSKYPAPFALIYRNMAVLGVEGFSTLPKNCLLLCCVFFAAAILMNLVRDALGKERAWFIPLPMAMAIPFYLGSYFAIDMCIGCLILFIWGKVNKADADACGPVVASGLICGDSVWTFPESILALAGVKPPICMKFLSRGTNRRVDKFLKPSG